MKKEKLLFISGLGIIWIIFYILENVYRFQTIDVSPSNQVLGDIILLGIFQTIIILIFVNYLYDLIQRRIRNNQFDPYQCPHNETSYFMEEGEDLEGELCVDCGAILESGPISTRSKY